MSPACARTGPLLLPWHGALRCAVEAPHPGAWTVWTLCWPRATFPDQPPSKNFRELTPPPALSEPNSDERLARSHLLRANRARARTGAERRATCARLEHLDELVLLDVAVAIRIERREGVPVRRRAGASGASISAGLVSLDVALPPVRSGANSPQTPDPMGTS